MAQHFRVGRLSQEIQREVNDILLKRVRDPRVKDVTITGVEVSGDLQHATIYYSIFKKLIDMISILNRLITFKFNFRSYINT